ncbi:unnamed protein product [Chrysoparadoxa australica]
MLLHELYEDPLALTALALCLSVSMIFILTSRGGKQPAAGLSGIVTVPIGLPTWLGFFGGQTLMMDPLHMVQVLEGWMKKYNRGGNLALYFLGKQAYTVTDPTMIKKILLNRPGKFIRGTSDLLQKLSNEMGLSPSLFFLEGSDWGTARRLTAPAFSAANVKLMLPSISKISKSFVEKLKRAGPDQFDIRNDCKKYAVCVIAELGYGHDMKLFDEPPSAEGQEMFDIVIAMLTHLNMRFFEPVYRFSWYLGSILPWVRKYRAGNKKFDDLLDGFIAKEQQATEKKEDGRGLLLRKLVAASNATGRMKLDMEGTRYNLKLYFVAGADTSSATLSWVIHYMMAIPRVQQKLHEEAIQVLGTDSAATTHEQVEALTYTMATVKEALRMWGPAPFLFMESKVDFEMYGASHPSGTMFLLMLHYICNLEENFSKPEEFAPERWLDDQRDAHFGPDSNHREECFSPFGGGARVCPGREMAFLGEVVAISAIAKDLKLTLPAGETTPDYINQFAFWPADVETIVEAR